MVLLGPAHAMGLFDQRLKVRLNAPPVDGKANEELIAFLSKILKLPKSKITIKSGLADRRKTVVLRCKPDLILSIFGNC